MIDQGEYLSCCPNGCLANYHVEDTDLETKDVTVTWKCNDCGIEWIEYYAFRYWKLQDEKAQINQEVIRD